jgi:molybdenum cofactor biosynthesis protein MoaC
MIDVGDKAVTRRAAVASCTVRMQQSTLDAIAGGELPKGDVLAVAQVAAVMAAKRTPELIPGCHPLRISAVEVSFETGGDGLGVRAEVRGEDRTGFEMEALTACAVAALTVYDMCKGVDADMEIRGLRLESKGGGKSDVARLDGVRVAVVTVSTMGAAGEREDTSGRAIREWFERRGASIVSSVVVPDDRERIASELRSSSADLVVTTGGTGVAPSDVTPEATTDAADKLVPGLAEVMRQASLRATPMAMISRGVAAIVGDALVINLPGSPKAVNECLDAVQVSLAHAVELLRGGRPH